MIRLKAAFFCDDIRHELGNKLSAVGIYNEAMLFPKGTGPVGVPKLGALFVVCGLKGIADIKAQQSVSFGDKTNALPEMTVHRTDVTPDEQNFIFQQVPAVFSSEGVFVARLQVTVEGEPTHTF